jgi:hypothetical protein
MHPDHRLRDGGHTTNKSSMMPLHTKTSKLLSRTGLMLLVLLTLSACTTKMAYNFLDWAIEWKVQRMVKLQGEQKILTQKAIKDFHHWHRTTQLPQYADYLHHLQKRLNDGPITAQEIHAETDKVQLLADQSVEKVLPDAAEVLAMLSDAQVNELLKSVAEERDEYKEEYVDPSTSKRHKLYYKKFLKHAQDWLGTLSKAQKEQVKTWSEQLEPFETLNLEQQKIWEKDLATLLAQRQDKAALLKGLQNLMFHRTDNWQPELEAILDRNQAMSYQLIADLLNGMSEAQRKHMNKKIEDYVKLFGELAGEKGR